MHYKYILVLLLLYTTGVYAQVKEIGIKTGITNSIISIQRSDSAQDFQSYKTSRGQSFYVQAYAQVYHYSNLSVQAGLGMIEKNSKYEYKIKPTNFSDSISVTTPLETRAFFIEFNAKLKLLIPELPKVVPYLLIGMQYNMLNKQTHIIDFTLQERYFQGVVGVGADFDIKKVHFFVEYNKFLNFNTNYSKDPDYRYTEKSAAFLVGLKFLLKSEKS